MGTERCRLCLTESTEIQSIFDSKLYQSVPLSVKVAVCISLPITQEDHFSKFICKKCRMLVDKFYSFRESCMSNYIHLLGFECSRVTELDELITISYDMNLKPLEDDSEPITSYKTVELDEELAQRTVIDMNLALDHPSDNFSESVIVSQDPENETTGTFILQGPTSLSNGEDNCDGNVLVENTISSQYITSVVEDELREVTNNLEETVPEDNIEISNQLTTEVENNVESDSEVVYSEFEEIITPSSEYIHHEAMAVEVNAVVESDDVTDHLYQSESKSSSGDKEDSQFISHGTKEFPTSSTHHQHFEESNCVEDTNEMREELSYLNEEVMECDVGDGTGSKSEIKESTVSKGRARWGEKRKYPCETCGKTFNTPAGLQNHVRMHTGERPFLCSLCTRSFSQKGALLNHERKHRGEFSYSCEQCGKGFFRPSDVNKHMRSHTDERPFLCTICSKGFHQNSGLVVHERIHTGERPYSCHICQMTFTQLSNKYRHMNTHAGGRKPFNCVICHRKFADQKELDIHCAVHDGAKARICHICKRGFRKPYELKAHLRRFHTNERPFVCQLCNKSFFVANDLKNHLYIHTGERPFPCNLCSRTFTQAGNLKRHLARHHPNQDLLATVINPDEFLCIQHVGVDNLEDPKLDAIE